MQLSSFFNLSTTWGGWLMPHSGYFAPRNETSYPLYRRLGGPQGGLDGCRKSWGVELRVSSALGEGEGQLHGPVTQPEGRAHRTRWFGHTVGLNTSEKTEIWCPCWEWNPNSQVFQPKAWQWKSVCNIRSHDTLLQTACSVRISHFVQ